jgi:hypothetical protein
MMMMMTSNLKQQGSNPTNLIGHYCPNWESATVEREICSALGSFEAELDDNYLVWFSSNLIYLRFVTNFN